MIPSLSQEELTQYASDAQTIQQPQGTDYSQGVKAGRTIPAKWWNWLFSASTKRIVQARSDADNMLTELKNVVTDAGLTPTASDNTQLGQAVVAKANTQIDNFVAYKSSLFITSWRIGQIYIDDSDTAVTYDSSMRLIDCFEGGPTGSVIVANTPRDAISYYSSYQLMYSLDAIHWYTVRLLRQEVAIWLLGNYLYFVYGYNVYRVDLRIRGRVDNPELLYRIPSGSSTTYNQAFLIPFDDCIFCFMYDGTLRKFSNASDTSELIDDTGLGQTNLSTSSMTRTAVPVVRSDGYYIGNVKVSLDRSTWTPIAAITSSDEYSLGSTVCHLADNNVAIASMHMMHYYLIDSNNEGHQVDRTDVASDIYSFSFGEDFIAAVGSNAYNIRRFSLDGQNYTAFSDLSPGTPILKIGGYYYLLSGVTVYRSETLSSEKSDYTAVYTASDSCRLLVVPNSPYIFVRSDSGNPITTPLGTVYADPIYAIILGDRAVQPTPTLKWPDGTVTPLFCSSPAFYRPYAAGNLLVFGGTSNTGGGGVDFIFYTSKGLNNVIGHTLYLR